MKSVLVCTVLLLGPADITEICAGPHTPADAGLLMGRLQEHYRAQGIAGDERVVGPDVIDAPDAVGERLKHKPYHSALFWTIDRGGATGGETR